MMRKRFMAMNNGLLLIRASVFVYIGIFRAKKSYPGGERTD